METFGNILETVLFCFGVIHYIIFTRNQEPYHALTAIILFLIAIYLGVI